MLGRICKDAWDKAVEDTKRKCSVKDDAGLLRGLREGDGCLHGYFRFHLVSHLSDCLSSRLKALTGIYLFGSSLSEHVGVTSDINLIIHTREHDPDGERGLQDLNKEISRLYCEMLGLETKDCFSLLDYHVIDDDQVGAGDGVAALLGSSLEPALMIWPDEGSSGGGGGAIP